jgi:signal transduction histidine kinase
MSELFLTIRRLHGGDYSVRLPERGRNELVELGKAFNALARRLDQSEQVRKQFVSNASHELKTPLSTIKILIETLLYQDPMDPGMAKEFMTDVNKEIDRLNRIVSDLLTLVNIDSGVKHLTEYDGLYADAHLGWLKLYLPARSAQVLRLKAPKPRTKAATKKTTTKKK